MASNASPSPRCVDENGRGKAESRQQKKKEAQRLEKVHRKYDRAALTGMRLGEPIHAKRKKIIMQMQNPK